MNKYKTQVEFSGRMHETFHEAATIEGAVRKASKAWYLSGVQIQANGDGKDLTGPYHRFLLTHGQQSATCRIYACRDCRAAV